MISCSNPHFMHLNFPFTGSNSRLRLLQLGHLLTDAGTFSISIVKKEHKGYLNLT